jgi:RHS repeat-associated protein
LNRLTTSSESGGAWSQTNKYDRYGNRAIDLGGGNQSLYFNSANRITNAGYVYDAAGNLTSDGIQSFAYDAENKIKTVNGVSDVYRYDGDGNRVRKNFATGEKVRMVYSGGQLVAEYDLTTGSLKKEYVYGGKGLLATVEPGTGTRYTTSDHLGSPRVVTNSSGGVVSRHDYMPFGEELGAGAGARTTAMGFVVNDGVRQKFTSKERDTETGLDYFNARYYASSQGRFPSPDPLYYTSLRPSDPQQFNLYSYVRNAPLVMVDPDGRDGYLKAETQEAFEKGKREVKRVAPGTRIDGDGKIHKPGFFRRILNNLTGHGAGTALISRIADAKNVTLIRATEKNAGLAGLPSSRMTAKFQDMTGCAAVGCDYYIELNVNYKGTSHDRMPDGSIAEAPFDLAVGLAHELIHADIFNHYGDTFSGEDDTAVHSYTVGGQILQEQSRAGEFLATGLPFEYKGTKKNVPSKWGITENEIRRELMRPPRATYK